MGKNIQIVHSLYKFNYGMKFGAKYDKKINKQKINLDFDILVVFYILIKKKNKNILIT